MKRWRGIRLFTVGHSTRSLDELVALLRGFGVKTLVDIRTVPRSRHNPQFNAESLPKALARNGIRWAHLAKLGGLRHTRKDSPSPNTGWRNASFRGFADYMQTEGFEEGLAELRELAAAGTVAVMCAEAVPWRCHRSLVADALTVRGAHVEHISSPTHASPHRLTPFAEVKGTRVTYPGGEFSDGRLPATAPFHLEATVRLLQRRASNRVELWEDEKYRRVVRTSGGLRLVEVENRGTLDEPDVRFSFLGPGALPPVAVRTEVGHRLSEVLGLTVDPAPFQKLAEKERALRPTALALRGMRPPRFAEMFEIFANVVPFQQVSLDAGIAVLGRIVERYGEPFEHEGRKLRAFPTADTVSRARPESLKSCGLSLRKAEVLRDLARRVVSGELSEEKLSALGTDEALKTLVALPGVGPWSASLVLLRGLRRLDVFPPGDVGVARGLGKVLNLESKDALEGIVERFGAYRGYLYFCALGGSMLAKGLIHPAPTVR